MRIWIARLGNSAPVALAAEELCRYFHQMDKYADVALLVAKEYDPEKPNTLWVGESAAFDALLPSVKERELDDGVYVSVQAGCGIVTGTNARSVLQAAYRLLKENGCIFLRPGVDGEYIPARSLKEVSAQVCEAASSRHRGVCIEGAVRYENVRDMIAYLPKVGMNAYFFQFFTPTTFFARWYEHEDNPLYESEPLHRDDVAAMRDSLVEEIKKRGLMYHAVGHGWTCEPFGVEGDSWISQGEEVLTEEIKPLLAEVDGKRALWGGVPLNTNLCYGNPQTRTAITHSIADYCAAHPEVDYLHFWLADGTNNHCECPLCRDTLPADFYVMMLNELDAEMTRRGIPTRVVFLIYVDLLWEPKVERIQNPDRFVLMFAPITRTYSTTFLPDKPFEGELTPYIRNKNEMPSSVAENVERLKKWQEIFSGDSFDFDYHFMWDHFKDLGYYQMADILMEDMKNLGSIGLNGMISCQNQRVFFPTALGMQAMAEALWNKDADFEALADRYFCQAYGQEGERVQGYLRRVSELLDPPYIRDEKPVVDEEQAEGYRRLVALVDSFRDTIEEGLVAAGDACRAHNWRMLGLHAEVVVRLARTLEKCAMGDAQGAQEMWWQTADYVRAIEPEAQEDFDVLLFQGTMKVRSVLTNMKIRT